MTRSKSRTVLGRTRDEKRHAEGCFDKVNFCYARERSNPLKTGFWRCIMQITIAIKVRYYQQECTCLFDLVARNVNEAKIGDIANNTKQITDLKHVICKYDVSCRKTALFVFCVLRLSRLGLFWLSQFLPVIVYILTEFM
ncbi:hypothetical protein T4A_13597 [Trichinella pseudospiralis]|uniref:Uncharacterized protein n=1 Tax=Trichinella pseudospiralis TaxID=6337 RepID=A0A0V1E5X0_TRIPS|nr:hypothetical protein T4A_13597 [Trichinella pseudospiralis]